MEIRSGSIYVRQCDELLPTGHVVEGHEHNGDHTTFFEQGLWECEKRAKVLDANLNPIMLKKIVNIPNVGLTEIEVPQLMSLGKVPIQGGTPFSFVLIDATLQHRFKLLKGPGSYKCVYSHRVPIEAMVELELLTGAYQHLCLLTVNYQFSLTLTQIERQISELTGKPIGNVKRDFEIWKNKAPSEVVKEYNGWHAAYV